MELVRTLYFLFAATLFFGDIQNCNGDCVWYGICGHQPNNPWKLLNCPYSGPPRPFQTEEAKNLFAELCPDLSKGSNVTACCSDDQLTTLANQIAIPREVLRRCPSCYHNFVHLWCHFTCSPKQDEFITINKTMQFTNTGKTEIEAVVSVDCYVSERSIDRLFNSCRSVQNPSTNTPVLSFLCGTSIEKCTPMSWLAFMGTTRNGQTPFDIWFHSSNSTLAVNGTTIQPLEYNTIPCHKSPSKDTQACSCQDCVDSCIAAPVRKPKPGRCRILDIDCFDFGFMIGYIVFVLLFGAYSIFPLVRSSVKSQDGCRTVCCKHKGFSPNKTDDAAHNSGKSDEKLPRRCSTIGIKMEIFLERMFFKWGFMCARHPFIVMIVVLVISGALSAGIALFSVTTDPVQLWSAPTSRARKEKDYFDSHFVPFYRIQQLIISRGHNTSHFVYRNRNYTSVFEKDFLHKVLDLQTAITTITADHNGRSIRLTDICFAPLTPTNNNCTIQSVLNYYQNSHEMIDLEVYDEYGWDIQANYLDHLEQCFLSPFSVDDTTAMHASCLGTYGGPVFPWVALGGFTNKDYRTSEALVVTFLINNHLEPSLNGPAKAWESKFLEFMQNYNKNSQDIQVAFSAERSIEDELDRQSQGDIFTILGSYLLMFGYVSVCLGQYMAPSRILVDAKLSLGLAGVILVIVSVCASLGFYSYVGVPSTLIIIEVVPFLVLAVGVDNIFIMVQRYQREMVGDGEAAEHMIGRVLGHVGPSMLLTSMSESVAFFLGALTEMPAVKAFSLYAAMAVLINFLLQISIFVALMTIDAKRQEANRIDVACCIKLPLKKRKPQRGLLYTLFHDYYSHFILSQWIRPLVVLVFVASLCVNAALTSRISIGLNQMLSVPKDSYLLHYFNNLSEYLSVGAPVYFVVEDGIDYSTYSGQNNICGVSGCPEQSLVLQINDAARFWTSTYIAEPVTSWLDDYFSWVLSPTCCRYYVDTLEFCPSTVTNATCAACPLDHVEMDRPVNQTFNRYLSWFLEDIPGMKCSKGGHAAYGTGVQLYKDYNNVTQVGASYFMTYHTILKTSEDYIEALRSARQISENITRSLDGTGIRVFPYSIFYVFYEQYLDIVATAFINLAYCLAAILVITFLLLGFDLHSAIIVVVTIIMIIINITGLMYLWDIELNALSIVNLIMATGISVEFCSHIVRSFVVSCQTCRIDRAKNALSEIGSSVLSGISLTKVVGIIMLAFAKSQIFQVFYFRMYLAIVVYGALHGLVFLPVFMSYVGPSLNKTKIYKPKPEENAETIVITNHQQQPHTKDTPLPNSRTPPSYDAVSRN